MSIRPSRQLRFALALTLGLATGLAATSRADDTEIYVGNSSLFEGLRPNVLFIFDTSGSMALDDGLAANRMTRLQNAMFQVLDLMDNVNVGIMRFSDPGGPVLFPVTYIDADASAIDRGSQPDVSVSISDGNDDVEELLPAHTVALDDLWLDLGEVGTFGTNFSRTFEITSSLDDYSGFLFGGGEFPLAGFTTLLLDPRFRDGLRFQNVTIPRNGAGGNTTTILRATLRFVSSLNQSTPTTLRISGDDIGDSPPFPTFFGSGPDTVTGRLAARRTTAQVDWQVHVPLPEWFAGESYFSADLKSIVQEIIDRGDWNEGNALSFLIEPLSGSRRAQTYDTNRSSLTAPRLDVEYQVSGGASGKQIVALRFRDVRIPQGVDIKRANIELVPTEDTSREVKLRILGVSLGDAPAFGTAPGSRPSDLPTTSEVKDWHLKSSEPWTANSPVQSPNIKKIVEEIVGRNDWCGGNDMAFLIEIDPASPAASRGVFSFESDPVLAAKLQVDFDERSVIGRAGKGCTVKEIRRVVAGAKDDAEQDIDLGSLALVSPTLEFFDDGAQRRKVGIRFRNVTVPPGARILSADITLTASSNESGAAEMRIQGESIGDSPEFATGETTDVSGRLRTTSSVTWNAGSTPALDATTDPSGSPIVTSGWIAGSRYTTPDLSAIIDEIVNNRSLGWAFGNAMTFLFEGTGLRRAKSFDGDAAFAPSLRVKFQVNLGDLPEDQVVFTSVRERLKEIVRGLSPGGYTPIVDTLYEAARYYRGEPVLYGLRRGSGASGTAVQQSTRVSHSASYINGKVERPGGCRETNLSSLACITEEIVADGGTPTYVTPIDTACQSSFIVLLTDGIANHNNSANLIKSLTGTSACQTRLSDGSAVRADEACGLDLVRFLQEQDQLPPSSPSAVPGANKITTYTIGFNISTQWLRDLATAGGGKFFTADTTESLVSVFQQIFAEVLSQNTSFAAPSLSVNAFNKLFHRNEVYFSLFKPSDTARWAGNVKKYRVRSTCAGLPASRCTVGEVIDANDNPAINVDDQRIRDTAQSFWTEPGSPDGADTLKGGAGAELIGTATTPIHPTRRIFTWIETRAPASDALVRPDRRYEIRDDNSNGVLDGLESGRTFEEGLDATKDLLGWPGPSVARIRLLERAGRLSSAEASRRIADLAVALHGQIQWIRGQDVDDEDGDGDTDEDRYSFTDPLHSSPIAVTYGATDTSDPTSAAKTPIIKLFVGTNDGAIRMINASNYYDDAGSRVLAGDSGGKEEWAFYPRSVLPNLVAVRRNASSAHLYGIDGTPTVWVNDENGDGVIDPSVDVDGDGSGEFVHLYVGMRRGGTQIFAFDVTPSGGPLNNATAIDAIDPVYLWRIDGGSTEYPNLYQTWSRPQLAQVLIGDPSDDTTSRRDVLIFAGGYDDSYDGTFPSGGGGSGNAVYIADAKTGERLLSVSADDPGSGDRVVVPGMVYPIPSDIALMDSDGDRTVDRLYVGDVGGQLWRIDLAAKSSTNSPRTALPGIKATVGMLATVSDPATLADHRKFFYRPDVVQVRSDGTTSASDYDLVIAVTGARPSPLNTDVQDRAYALRDLTTGRMADADGDGLADSYATIQGPLSSVPGPGDLFDVTTIIDPTATVADATRFASARGWYLDFQAAGEKALAAPIVLAGKLFFTTYLPEDVISTTECAIAEGKGQLYGLNVLTGGPAFNWESGPTAPTRVIGDRTMDLGGGIPSGAVPIFQPEAVTLLIGGGGGATVVNPDIDLPRERTYWFEEQ